VRSPWLRPAVHAGAFAFSFLPFVFPAFRDRWWMVGAALAALLVNSLVLPRTDLGRSLRREGEPLWNGQLSYPLAVAVAYAIWDPLVAQVAWAVMAFGDPAAFLAGKVRPWKARIPWNRRKSAAGSLAFVAVAWAATIGVVVLHFRLEPVPWIDRPELTSILLPVAIVALAGAVAESIPWPVDDNLPVTLAAGVAVLLVA
jgi:dolichol kinase